MAERKGKRSRGASSKDLKELRKKALEVIKRLRPLYESPKLELEFSTPFELLVMAILAAQESDKRVNEVRPALFAAFPTAREMARARQEKLEELIKSINFYRRKAKLVIECARRLVELYDGEVPKEVEKLEELPGVGRKTASMVAGCAYGTPALIVDRHVHRVSLRLGLTKEKNPDKAEEELRKIVPKRYWLEFSLLLMTHGKRICKARKPDCGSCPLTDLCDYFLSVCPQV
ncbi:MAG: endonuclease III [Aquificae bacterium]|nr:endonuclease III [Aquificota bacterium]